VATQIETAAADASTDAGTLEPLAARLSDALRDVAAAVTRDRVVD
jgi:hypothetical protein